VVQLNAFLISTLDASNMSASCLNYFTLEEIVPRYPLDSKLSGSQSLEIMGRKISCFCQETTPIV
jgi:hypothetical protein